MEERDELIGFGPLYERPAKRSRKGRADYQLCNSRWTCESGSPRPAFAGCLDWFIEFSLVL